METILNLLLALALIFIFVSFLGWPMFILIASSFLVYGIAYNLLWENQRENPRYKAFGILVLYIIIYVGTWIGVNHYQHEQEMKVREAQLEMWKREREKASASKVSEVSGSRVQEVSGSKVSEVSGSRVSETSGSKVSETSGSRVQEGSGSRSHEQKSHASTGSYFSESDYFQIGYDDGYEDGCHLEKGKNYNHSFEGEAAREYRRGYFSGYPDGRADEDIDDEYLYEKDNAEYYDMQDDDDWGDDDDEDWEEDWY